tara:strand:- start:29 stop:256 length:228 start_codon:yes stop_codon:yes gene_type:complete
MTKLFAMVALLGMCSGCSYFKQNDVPPPSPLSAEQDYLMSDSQGNTVGYVTLKSIGNGVVRDTRGRVIGFIVPPQ